MLEKELNLFLKDDQSTGHHHLTATLHTKTDDLTAIKVSSVDCIGEFSIAYTDRYTVVAMFNSEDFFRRILPAMQNLELTLFKRTTAETFVIRMKAIIAENTLNTLKPNSFRYRDAESIAMVGLVRVELQCKPTFAEAASTLTLHGNYLSTPLDMLMSKVIKYYMDDAPVYSGKALDEVVISPINNTVSYKQVLVPSGTLLLRLPKHLQERYGVYTASIGSYLRPFEDGRKVWWIYPTYGNILWNDTTPCLRILVFYSKIADNLKNTIQRDGNVLIIIAELLDAKSPVMDNRPTMRPTNVNVVDMSRVIESPATYQPGEVLINRNDRMKTLHVYDRNDGTEAVSPNTLRTNNLYTATASMTANTTSTLAFKWTHALHELLIPGMQTEVLIEGGKSVDQGFGRLGGIHSVCAASTAVGDTPRCTETVILSVHINRTQ